MSVEELRRAFSEKFPDANQRFEFADVQRFNSCDSLAQAFLLANDNNVSDAVVQAEKSMNFRRESDINNLNEDSFPLELRQKGAIFYRNEDRKGSKILVFRIKENRRDPAVIAVVKNYVAYMIDLEHRKDPTQKIVLLFDMSGAGLSNFDPDLVRFTITCFDTYFPHFLAYLLVFDMPFILNAAWRLIRNWLSEKAREKIIFVKKKDITQYVAPEQLAPHMGGTDEYEHVCTEEDCLDGAGETPSSSFTPTEEASELRRRFDDGDSRIPRSHSADDAGLAKATSFGPPSNGALVSVTPASRLVLKPGDTSHNVSLKNTSATPVVFKMNTTLPSDFRVRPSSGLLAPQETAVIVVSWAESSSTPAALARGRFQILAMAAAEGAVKATALTALRSSTRDQRWEHRLSCAREGEMRSGADITSNASFSFGDQFEKLSAQQKSTAARLDAMNVQLWRLTALCAVGVGLVFLTLLLLLFRA